MSRNKMTASTCAPQLDRTGCRALWDKTGCRGGVPPGQLSSSYALSFAPKASRAVRTELRGGTGRKWVGTGRMPLCPVI